MALDQQNTSVAGGSFGLRRSATDNLYLAQKFTAGITGGLTQVDLEMGSIGCTGNMWVEIWTDSAGAPGVKIGGQSANFDVSVLTGGVSAFRTFSWSTNYPILSNGTSYWIVVKGDYTFSTSANVQWDVNNNASFSEGQGFDGTSWAAKTTWRFLFKTYVDSTITGVSPGTSFLGFN